MNVKEIHRVLDQKHKSKIIKYNKEKVYKRYDYLKASVNLLILQILHY